MYLSDSAPDLLDHSGFTVVGVEGRASAAVGELKSDATQGLSCWVVHAWEGEELELSAAEGGEDLFGWVEAGR